MIEVSVLMLTYGHEKFLSQAIEGVLMQQGDFKLELMILNDASPDNTDEIIESFIQTHPRGKVITHVRNVVNIGAMKNSVQALQRVASKYVALCEGDDYWTDSSKLAKQVHFMEANPGYSLCFHSVAVENNLAGKPYKYPKPAKTTLVFEDLLVKHFIPTCSIFYRNAALPKPLPPFYAHCVMGDLPLELLLAHSGKVCFIDEEMAVYRKHEGGITRSKEQIALGRRGYTFLYKSLIKHCFPHHIIALSQKLFKNYLGYVKDKFL